MTGPWERASGPSWPQVVDEGRWRAPRTFDARGPAGILDGAPPSSPSRPTTISASSAHPAVVAAAHEALDALGRRLRRLPPGHRQPPRPRRARARAGRVEGHRGRRLLPDRLRRQPRRAVRAGRPGRARALRRAEPRQHHRRLPALPRRPSPSTATATWPTSRSCSPAPRARRTDASPPRRRWWSPTRSSPWTGTRPRSTTSSALCARHDALLVLDEAHAVLGPHLAAAAVPTPAPIVRVGTLSKTLGLARAASWRPPATSSTSSSTGPAPTSSRPRSRRPTPPPRSPRSGSCVLPKARP